MTRPTGTHRVTAPAPKRPPPPPEPPLLPDPPSKPPPKTPTPSPPRRKPRQPPLPTTTPSSPPSTTPDPTPTTRTPPACKNLRWTAATVIHILSTAPNATHDANKLADTLAHLARLDSLTSTTHPLTTATPSRKRLKAPPPPQSHHHHHPSSKDSPSPLSPPPTPAERNARRRVYDALKVMVAAGAVVRTARHVRFVGVHHLRRPPTPAQIAALHQPPSSSSPNNQNRHRRRLQQQQQNIISLRVAICKSRAAIARRLNVVAELKRRIQAFQTLPAIRRRRAGGSVTAPLSRSLFAAPPVPCTTQVADDARASPARSSSTSTSSDTTAPTTNVAGAAPAAAGESSKERKEDDDTDDSNGDGANLKKRKRQSGTGEDGPLSAHPLNRGDGEIQLPFPFLLVKGCDIDVEHTPDRTITRVTAKGGDGTLRIFSETDVVCKLVERHAPVAKKARRGRNASAEMSTETTHDPSIPPCVPGRMIKKKSSTMPDTPPQLPALSEPPLGHDSAKLRTSKGSMKLKKECKLAPELLYGTDTGVGRKGVAVVARRRRKSKIQTKGETDAAKTVVGKGSRVRRAVNMCTYTTTAKDGMKRESDHSATEEPSPEVSEVAVDSRMFTVKDEVELEYDLGEDTATAMLTDGHGPVADSNGEEGQVDGLVGDASPFSAGLEYDNVKGDFEQLAEIIGDVDEGVDAETDGDDKDVMSSVPKCKHDIGWQSLPVSQGNPKDARVEELDIAADTSMVDEEADVDRKKSEADGADCVATKSKTEDANGEVGPESGDNHAALFYDTSEKGFDLPKLGDEDMDIEMGDDIVDDEALLGWINIPKKEETFQDSSPGTITAKGPAKTTGKET